MNFKQNLTKGFFKENAVFVLLLGLCPTLAVSNSAINGLGMGLATTFVLMSSNIVISLVKNFIPDKVRIPSFIVIIATFVTLVDLTMSAYLPSLHASLGIFIPLIVVNCIVLARAEAFASKNSVFDSMIDGISMGLGFAMALTILGIIRELLGAGSIFGINVPIYPVDESGNPVTTLIFILAPGAFMVLGYVIAIINRIRKA
ncbi:MAG TPA: electron transport complex subunit E [Salinivirgaceae bacterium]|nr:electron transport complex subunit E [Salinivirgaceae bacterium]